MGEFSNTEPEGRTPTVPRGQMTGPRGCCLWLDRHELLPSFAAAGLCGSPSMKLYT